MDHVIWAQNWELQGKLPILMQKSNIYISNSIYVTICHSNLFGQSSVETSIPKFPFRPKGFLLYAEAKVAL